MMTLLLAIAWAVTDLPVNALPEGSARDPQALLELGRIVGQPSGQGMLLPVVHDLNGGDVLVVLPAMQDRLGSSAIKDSEAPPRS